MCDTDNTTGSNHGPTMFGSIPPMPSSTVNDTIVTNNENGHSSLNGLETGVGDSKEMGMKNGGDSYSNSRTNLLASTPAISQTRPRDNLSMDSQETHDKVFKELCYACRMGHIEKVDKLLETPNLNLNHVDEWDYSPLILLSLCGHYEVVELLLMKGAICDRDTFEGARCVYSALTDKIRDLLLSYEYTIAVDSTQPFVGHISSFLNTTDGLQLKDIAFYFPHVHGVMSQHLKAFRLHRFFLSARSSWFRKKLAQEWNSDLTINMLSVADPVVFQAVVNYLYLRTDSIPFSSPEIMKKLYLVAKEYDLDDLAVAIESMDSTKTKKEMSVMKSYISMEFVDNAKQHFSDFLSDTIFQNKVQSFMLLQEDIDYEEVNVNEYISDEQKRQLFQCSAAPDIILAAIDIDTESIIYYPVNKMIISRSEYFENMFRSRLFSNRHEIPHFNDVEKTGNIEIVNRHIDNAPALPVINMRCSSKITELILEFLYSNDIKNLELYDVVDLFFKADELLLEQVKTICALKITSRFNGFTWDQFLNMYEQIGYNAYDLLRIAWEARNDKLDGHVTKMIAYNIDNIYHSQDEKQQLLLLIDESARKIKQRHETDTIELVDEIRYYLSKKYAVDEFQGVIGPISDEEEKHLQSVEDQLQNDIRVIDLLLEELSLDA
jgi:hypothetical protein